jgi:glycosyltransferase involved in cell wall biosynthesis
VRLPPSVDVVIPTRDRPDFVRAAIASVRAQDYAGRLIVYVVFDGEEPDVTLADDGPVPVCVLRNERKPGLCGARNTGILAGSGDLVAFLDDDDRWLAGKLREQVSLLQSRPDAAMATTSIRIEFGDAHTDRFAGTDTVTHQHLLRSRMAMLHSSTFLLRRTALVDGSGPGLVDETAPQGQNEDWDLLLRYSAAHPIAHLDQPLVAVRWGSTSMFAQAWRSKVDGARWILERHPDIATSRIGHARVLAQIAFAHAALGERRLALRGASASIRVRWREPRAYLAVLAALGVRPTWILRALHARGHGV